MSVVGNIYVDATSKKQYKCLANITISPTLINDRVTTYGVWQPFLAGSGETIIESPKTIVLEDEDGNRVVAVLVDQEVDFTATANDIREGKIAATDDGVTIGEKFIPTYLATQGIKLVTSGSSFYVKLADNDLYDYSKFQAIICPLSDSIDNSTACDKVVINNNLYEALSTVSISQVSSNTENKTIVLGITNTASSPYLIRYFTFKEV